MFGSKKTILVFKSKGLENKLRNINVNIVEGSYDYNSSITINNEDDFIQLLKDQQLKGKGYFTVIKYHSYFMKSVSTLHYGIPIEGVIHEVVFYQVKEEIS